MVAEKGQKLRQLTAAPQWLRYIQLECLPEGNYEFLLIIQLIEYDIIFGYMAVYKAS